MTISTSILFPLILLINPVFSFLSSSTYHSAFSRQSKSLVLSDKNGKSNNFNNDQKVVIVELITSRKLSTSVIRQEREQARLIAYESVYEEPVEDNLVKALDSPLGKIFQVCFNPTTLMLALYASSIGWSRMMWLQKILKIFGRGTLVTKPGETPKPNIEDLPFQIFECEKCGMELRPARGRAEAIFAKPRFRCSRCGSKASAYFNIEDTNDPRAVARLERIEKEKRESDEEMENYDPSSDDDKE